MAEAQFASLDGTAMYSVGDDYTPNPNAIARRSISIFSRRGAETPEPKPPFIAQAAMKTPRQMTERQKSWIGRRKSVCVGSSPKTSSPVKPKGTILNAVPPAKKIHMTALEEEMATSPNEEILTAVSEQSPTQLAWTPHSYQTTPTQQTSFWNKSSVSLTQRSKSENRSETHNRIGTWVNGVTQWDDEVCHYGTAVEELSLEQETGFTPVRPIVVDGLSASLGRPNLSVVIPGDKPRVNDRTLSTLVQPRPRKPVVSVAPAGIVSKFNMTPTITVEEVADFSPLVSGPTLSGPPSERLHEPLVHDSVSSQERPKASRTSSSSSSLADQDDTSIYSKRSSATSVETVEAAPVFTERSRKRLSGKVLSIPPKKSTGVDEDAASNPRDVNKPLPPNPVPAPERSAPERPSSNMRDHADRKVRQSRSMKSAPGGSRTIQPIRPKSSTRSLTQLDLVDQEFMRTSPYARDVPECASPTLSQAENDLQAHLSNIEEHRPSKSDDATGEQSVQTSVVKSGSVRRNGSVRSVMQPPERAPTVPKRSRKRDWRAPAQRTHVAKLAAANTPVRSNSDSRLGQPVINSSDVVVPAARVRRCMSAAQVAKAQDLHHFAQLLPLSDEKIVVDVVEACSPLPRIVIDDGLIVVRGPVVLGENGEEVPATAVAATSAEEVLLQILSALTTTKDVFSTAMINKGMYRVYKENEMHLIRTVVFNQSPAAWEFREWCPPGRNLTESGKAASQLEHNPQSYTRCEKRDVAVIESLKALILEKCQTFIRRETAFAISTPSHPNAQRYNDAFWRIWCFCEIFGTGKNREDDVTGQLDWLKGGLLANNQGCVATVNTNLDFDMSSVLLNAPEFFAKGNANGLSAQQLYDMTEIWTCLSALLQAYQGHVEDAREFGIFDACEITDGDAEREEQMLEEWTYHLLTLGPAVVLNMAELATNSPVAGFAMARENGWTKWSPSQYCGSRGTFLKEPVARMYEERVATAAQQLRNPREQERKDMSRKRVATLAAEIRLRRQTSTYRRSPYINMSTERPMSTMSRRDSTMSTRTPRIVSLSATPTAVTPVTPTYSARPTSPNTWSPRKISPIIEDRVESFNRMSLQNFAGLADDTSGRAVKKIVDMGFSAAQARGALKMTDMGDGLRVDRAVDLLLRQC